MTPPLLRSGRGSRFAPCFGLLITFASAPGRAQPAPPVESAAPEPATENATGTPTPSAPPANEPAQSNAAAAPTPAAAQAPGAPQSEAQDAEAAALEAELTSQSSSPDVSEFKLNFYGFADFTFTQPVGDSSLTPNRNSFAVGKLNLYSAAELGDDWRSLAEIRFMYLPDGSTQLGLNQAPRTDTTTTDYTDLNRPVKWGGISIERAWLEHTFHPALTVRAGQWLTPYGIWNVDHGSPVIVGVRRPFIVGEALFPERQTGLELYGALGFGAAQFGYHVTLSNGRGPVDTYQDYDHNKAVGARLFWKQETEFGALTVGASGYRAKYTDAHDDVGLDSAGGIVFKHVVVTQYDELSLAADAKWEWGGLLVQSEAISNDVAYDDAHRPSDPGITGGPPGFSPDHRKFGVYGLAGYRTSFLGLMPFGGGEYYEPGLHVLRAKAVGLWGGLNCRPTPRVVLKAQYTHAFFPDAPAFGTLDILDLQAAWSF
jgi:hypothetical protein